MLEHLTEKQVEDYSLRRLPAAEVLGVGDHLAECEACRLRIEGVLNRDAAFVTLHADVFSDDDAAPAHLTAQKSAAYVDETLSGEALQLVSDHLHTCEQCAAAVNDLRVFRDQMAPALAHRYGPTRVPETSWREKLASLLKVGPVPAFATAALGVLLLVGIGWFIWRSPNRNGQQVVVVTPTPVPQPSATPEHSSQTPPAPAPAPVVVQLNDGGGVLTLDQDGKLAGADALPAAYQSLVKKALTTQRIERSSELQGLTRPSSSLMGSDGSGKEFSVLEPVGSVLLSNRPAFRWSKMEGATAYVVEVYDQQFKLVTSSQQLTTTSWSTTMERGKTYSWQVKALKDDQEITSPRPPSPQAKFRILDQAKANDIAQAKRAYASSHLTLGLLYADAGLLKEAEQEFRLLQRANATSPLPRSLLRQVQSLRTN